MSEPINDLERRLQEEFLRYYRRYREQHPLPPSWTERTQTTPTGHQSIDLENETYRISVIPARELPGRKTLRPMVKITHNNNVPFFGLSNDIEVSFMALDLCGELIGCELNPRVVMRYQPDHPRVLIELDHPKNPTPIEPQPHTE